MNRIFCLVIGVLFLSGCAVQKNVPLNETFWQKKNNKVVVATIKPAQPGVKKIGTQGLLDYAINSAMTDQLDQRLKKTNLDWYTGLSSELASKFKKHHIAAIVETNQIEDEKKQIANLAGKYPSNDILILKLYAVGVIRRYYGFIPLGAPQAYTMLEGKLYDPATKKVKWRHLAEVKLPVTGAWDQPPQYPNVIQTVQKTITSSRQEILDSLFSGQE